MTATYTTNGRFTKQGVNDNPNTWGTVANSQVFDLIDEAIFGVAQIDLTGSSDINISSTVVNGGTDTARHAVLELIGTIGANINLIVPALNKQYTIRAAYTGAFTVTVKPSGGSGGIVFNTGQSGIVYTKGTNIYDIEGTSLLKTNNLSDLTDVNAAKTNLGLTSLATATVGGGLTLSMSNVLSANANIVGEIKMWPTVSPPTGWLIITNTPISRTTYSALFAVIGTTFGVGDGTTTFNLPATPGRAIVGAGSSALTTRTLADIFGEETHVLTLAETPAHSHTVSLYSSGSGSTFPNIAGSGSTGARDTGLGTNSVGGGAAHNNLQPSIALNFIIYTGV